MSQQCHPGNNRIEMAEFPEEARDELDGFAIVAGRRGDETFSWEWFDIKGDSRAPKRQEGGELAYALVSVDSRWEVARTEVTSDVSFESINGEFSVGGGRNRRGAFALREVRT